MNKPVQYSEREKLHKLKALQAITVTIDQLSRNYPIEGVEQEVFIRVKRYLEIVRGAYEQT